MQENLTKRTCDQCGKEESCSETLIGPHFLDWIQVSCNDGYRQHSGDFCSWKCLEAFCQSVQKPEPSEKPDSPF